MEIQKTVNKIIKKFLEWTDLSAIDPCRVTWSPGDWGGGTDGGTVEEVTPGVDHPLSSL